MAMIVPPVITDVMEVHSNNKDFNEKERLINNDESDISKDISEYKDEEILKQKNEGNIEGNMKDTCDNTSSNAENGCYKHEKIQSNEVLDSLDKDSCLDDRIDINKANKGDEIRARNEYFDGDDNSNAAEKKLSKRFLGSLVDSDSEEETNSHETLNKESFVVNDSCDTESTEHLQVGKYKKSAKNKNRRIIDSESEDDAQTSDIDDFPQTVQTTDITTSNYQALIDSESEEEREETAHYSSITSDNASISEIKNSKKHSVQKRKGSIRASKDEAMRQIHSETQRLLRETEISLPYHRPKQRTLQEFLNRKKLSEALPKAPSTAARLKMSSAIVSQALAEKEKEAELFYKSSDSEDDMQQLTSSACRNMKKSSIINEKMPSIDIEHICIQDTQKIEINQNSHNKKEIIQQGHINLGVPRVLFGKDFCKEYCPNKELSPLRENSSNRDNGTQIEEYKQNVQRVSVSRKLFDKNFETERNEVSDINHYQQEIVEETVCTTLLDKEKHINNKKEPEITGNCILQISKVHQCDSEITDETRDQDVITKAIKIPETPCTSKRQTAEMLQRNDHMTSNTVTSTKSDDRVIEQDSNNKGNNKCTETNNITSSIVINDMQSEIQDNSLTDECKKSNSHVLGLPLPKFTDEILIDRKELLSELMQSSKVTLKGSPGMIIDLTGDVKSNRNGVNTLLDRFFNKHVNTNKQVNNKSEVTVIHIQDTQNGPMPIKEILPYELPINNNNPELNKPGAKLMRLKEDLKLKMTLKRNEEWKQKEIELQTQEKEEWDEEEESDCDDLDEQEKDNSESTDSGESEPEENDVCIKDKKRSKCLFADDEAEVTDDENSGTDTEEEACNESDTDEMKRNNKHSVNFKSRNKKKGMDDNISRVESSQEESDENLNADMEDESESNFKDKNNDNICRNISISRNEGGKKTKQLTQEFQDYSDSINSNDLENQNNQIKHIITDVDTFETRCKDNDWISDESNMPAFQQHIEVATRNQICNTPLTKTSMLDFVSPITQLSVLNTTLDSNKKDRSEKEDYLIDKHDSISKERTQSDKSPEYICSIKSGTIPQKKLFDIGENIDDEYLIQLCSGTFGSTQKTDLRDTPLQSNTTKSQSHEVCSENFGMKSVDVKQLESSEVDNEISQDIRLTLDEDFSNNFINHTKEVKKVGTMDSELKLRIASSDDEEQSDEADTFLKNKKRPAKRLILSDSEEENIQSPNEKNEDVNNEEEEEYVDYDSEENEIMVVPKKDVKKVAAEFVEEEAELSESDWDSADEDENDLDKLELEEADDEHIDEDEIKDQLGKIHMKQILDEDKREVRLLKELLFEDGDLHTDGTGRERKFKWKNIDKVGNNIEIPQMLDENDGCVDLQEYEEEAKWNKLKHERDKFLEERMKSSSNEIEDELYDSQIFKLGLEALKKIKNNKSQKQDAPLDIIDSSENMEPIIPQNITDLLNDPNTGKKSQTIYNIIKRRSLLTRGEESLARIASLARQSDSVSHTLNTRNFVFQYIDPCIDNTSKKNDTKEEGRDSQNKPVKRKVTSDISLTRKKRRK